jgi:pSer/pThr/pTyr-binding forkhead associated (FHA) protein
MSSDDAAGAEQAPRDEPAPSELTSTLSLGSATLGSAEVEPDVAEPDPDQAAVGALPEGSALLVVRRGPNAGSRFLLDVELVTAGRHPDSDIFLDDVTVSRRHAQFVRLGSGYAVKDVGSLNGTYVNRHRIDEAQLAGGDEVQIGKYRLVYLVGQGGSGSSGAAGSGGQP